MKALTLLIGFTAACAFRSGPAAPPPASVTPAAETVSSEEPARQNPTSIAQLLAGRIAGVTVTEARDGGIIVRFEGPTSFYSGQEPLILVDDMPVSGTGGTLSWLNPRDIESIRALRDPSETAIYGVRGVNGVILIKTKGSH